MTNLIPPASHSAVLMPAELRCSHPPTTPPATSNKIDAIRLFRFKFFDSGARSSGSENRSQYKLVSTFVGTSLIPSTLLMTICPPNWNASSASGIRLKALSSPSVLTLRSSSVSVVGRSLMPKDGTAPVCASAAATKMRHACRIKDADSVALRRGCRCRDLEKMKHPAQKATMETRARSQSRG